MEDSLYVKELLKVNNTWIGNTYNYKEAYEKIWKERYFKKILS